MKRFEKYAHREFKSLKKDLKKYLCSREPEVLHQIRVDIKKLKAILGVINDCQKGFKAHKQFIPFRNIFRRAGDIREADVLTQLLLRYHVEGIHVAGLSDNGEHLVADFEADMPRFIRIVKRRMNKLKPYLHRVHRINVRRYLRRKKKKVKSQLYPEADMGMIHEVRKAIKEVIYLSEADGKLKRKEGEFYDKMQDIIGQLHDKQVLLDWLKNEEAGSTPCEVIKSACHSDKEEIVSLANDFYGNSPVVA